jgi:hypothetical protein
MQVTWDVNQCAVTPPIQGLGFSFFECDTLNCCCFFDALGVARLDPEVHSFQ